MPDAVYSICHYAAFDADARSDDDIAFRVICHASLLRAAMLRCRYYTPLDADDAAPCYADAFHTMLLRADAAAMRCFSCAICHGYAIFAADAAMP